ncbi:MAG: outer membrane lipoprotein carrier protein LolA [Elusimicrobiota bacterium]
MLRKYLLFVIFFMIFVMPLRAMSGEELINKLQVREDAVKTMQFAYTQSIKSPEIEQENMIKGIVYFKKPNKFFIKTQSPYVQHFISNGDTLWIYTPENKQAIKRAADTLLQEEHIARFFDFIFNIEKCDEQYKSLPLRQNKNYYYLSLVSKQDNAEAIKLSINKELMFPQKIELFSGEITIATSLSAIKFDKIIKNKEFEFIAPKDVEIWEMED